LATFGLSVSCRDDAANMALANAHHGSQDADLHAVDGEPADFIIAEPLKNALARRDR